MPRKTQDTYDIFFVDHSGAEPVREYFNSYKTLGGAFQALTILGSLHAHTRPEIIDDALIIMEGGKTVKKWVITEIVR